MNSQRLTPVVVLLLLATAVADGLDIERLLRHRINVNKRAGGEPSLTTRKPADDYFAYNFGSSDPNKFDEKKYLEHVVINSDLVFWSSEIAQVLTPLVISLHEKLNKIGDADRCQPYVPFRCPGETDICISIQYLCDGAPDCPDGYDEDPRLCTAAKRPPVAETANFLQSLLANHGPNYLEKLFGSKARDALAPLGGVTKVAVTLSESQTIEDFGKALHLMRADLEHLRSVFMAVENGDLGMLKSLGIKDSELGDVKFFLDKLVHTGFMD